MLCLGLIDSYFAVTLLRLHRLRRKCELGLILYLHIIAFKAGVDEQGSTVKNLVKIEGISFGRDPCTLPCSQNPLVPLSGLVTK